MELGHRNLKRLNVRSIKCILFCRFLNKSSLSMIVRPVDGTEAVNIMECGIGVLPMFHSSPLSPLSLPCWSRFFYHFI